MSGTVDLVALSRQARSVGCELVSKEALDDLLLGNGKRQQAEKALVRIHGLLAHRRWWNDNVWAAQEIAKDVILGC